MLLQIVNELNETAKKIVEYNKLNDEVDDNNGIIGIDWSKFSCFNRVDQGFAVHLQHPDKEAVLELGSSYDNEELAYHAKYVDIDTTRVYVVEY